MARKLVSNNPIQDGVDFASESFVPGGSHLVRGDILRGGLHFVLGAFAKSLFGLPGLMFVKANSLAKARSGQSLLETAGSILTPTGTQAAQPGDKKSNVS